MLLGFLACYLLINAIFSDADEWTFDSEWQTIDIEIGLLISCCSWVGLDCFFAVDEYWDPSYGNDCYLSRALIYLVTSCLKMMA